MQDIETRNDAGQLHSIDDKPAKAIYEGGKLSEEAWYKNGKLHRKGKPAHIEYGEGKITERWYKHGKLHNDNGPAVIYRCRDEMGCHQYWYKNGKPYQDDSQPTYVHLNKHGKVDCIRWSLDKNTNYHREGDKPSAIWWRKNGQYSYQRWEKTGKTHRNNGPAIIYHHKGVIYNEWYVDGTEIPYDNVPEESRLSPDFVRIMWRLPLPIGEAIAWHCVQTWQFVNVG